jgi:hypothetical protein
MGHGFGAQRHNVDRPDVLGDCAVGENLGTIGLRFLHQQAVTVLLQRESGSQELVERALVQNWLVLRAERLALHVGG